MKSSGLRNFTGRKTEPAPHGVAVTLGNENGSLSTRSSADTIRRALVKGTPVRHRTFDEVIDGLQLLTPTDVCKLLRI